MVLELLAQPEITAPLLGFTFTGLLPSLARMLGFKVDEPKPLPMFRLLPEGQTAVFRFSYIGATAIDSGPDWLAVTGDAQAASPISLSLYETGADEWWEWTNAGEGSIHASVDQDRYPASSTQKKWGQFQQPALYPSHTPTTITVSGLDAGNYKAIVYAREHHGPFTNPGQRVFTIAANGGDPVNVDLCRDFGPLTVGAIELETTVSDGDLDLTFVSLVEAATWDAVEIIRLADTPASTAAPECRSMRLRMGMGL